MSETGRVSDSFFAARDHLLRLSGEPERARSEFRWPDVGDHFNWAHDVFDRIAADNDTTALWIAEETGNEHKRSFRELKRRSDQVANWLRGIGAKRGDIAMLMLGNHVELWEIMLAAMKLGVVILPTSVVLGPQELVDRVERGNVRWVFAGPEDAVKFAGIPGDFRGVGVRLDEGTMDQRAALYDWARFEESRSASVAPVEKETSSGDPALLYFTSGTTKLPKIAVHSHTSYPLGHFTTMSWLGVRPGDVHSVISAPGWAKHAWSSFFGPWNVGATVYVANYAKFKAERIIAELDRVGVTSFCAPPTVWRMLIQSELGAKPSALREIVSAGEPLNPEVISRIEDAWGLVLRDGYGQTETTATIGNMPGEPVVPGAMGRPLPGVDIVLIDPMTGEEGDEGEACLRLAPEDGGTGAARPVNLMTGYYGNPEATAEAMTGGFYHTGDVAHRDENGSLTFVGRTDDIFKASDFKVSPFEVESVLLEHDFVAEAAVVGCPDDTRLNVTKAYVSLPQHVAASEETAREILVHARKALPAYMRVRRVEFFELPKTTSGKIRRVELRTREEAAHSAGERITSEWREEDFPDLKDA
ncbi:AMP-binding protein [Leucobacter komagatae]|uniref:AMP-dependent synthetase n=1 Tax=Leucobacter komagatae TaxID=55969 RepID=A0A0D0IJ51_9MICO|nr:AMP-binding protein [Leucobacter komagatae]KIP51689.1 AMP-dependent synthetase [Leucobacter komagatae]